MNTIPPSPIRLLVAEDSAACRELLVAIFQNAPGIQVVGTARDGAEAVRLVKRLKPDVVTMDLIMPKVDGIEATHTIRKNMSADKKHIPIIALTASVIKSEIEKCYAAGMDGVIQKPFQEYQLFSALFNALTKKETVPGVGEAPRSVSGSRNNSIDLDYLPKSLKTHRCILLQDLQSPWLLCQYSATKNRRLHHLL